MATYTLSGSGVHALSANVTALHVTITTLPDEPGEGTANPTDYYDIALVRFGDAVGFFASVPIVGGPQWLAVPNGCTRIGYSCEDVVVLSVAEVIGGTPPFGGGATALAGLSDVSIVSPLGGDVLTYIGALAHWANVTPSGGGGTSVPFHGARYHQNPTTHQSIPHNSYTVVNFDVSDYDPDAAVTTGAAWHFTAIAAGHYAVTAYVTYDNQSWNSSMNVQMALYKNGSNYSTLYINAPTSMNGGYWGLGGSDHVNLSVGDTVSVNLYQNVGSGRFLLASGPNNYIAIALVH